MNKIKIQTKIKKKQKNIEFTGTYVPNRSMVILNFGSIIISKFITNLQKDQKLELFVDSHKIGNIRNLVVTKSHTGHKPELEFESIFLKQEKTLEKTKKIVDKKTSLQIFCDKWQKFNNHVDLSAVILAVFQIDTRMWQDYHIMSDEEQNELIRVAEKRIHKKIKEL